MTHSTGSGQAGTSITKYYGVYPAGGGAGTQRIAMRKDGALYYLIGDHLGSTSLVTDAAGTVVSETRYKAWGEVRYQSGVTPTEYGFTGQFSHAADFGLMFYNARWYDVSLGRFAQADSIVPPGVQGLDRYAYVNNSPLNYVDPSGHSYCDSEYAFEEDCNEGSGLSSFDSGNGDDDDNPLMECGFECAMDDLENATDEQITEWFTFIRDETISDGCSSTNSDPYFETCNWEFNSTDHKDLFRSFLRLLRTINEDPVNIDLLFGFIPFDPITGVVENIFEILRGNYYSDLANFEDSISDFHNSNYHETIYIKISVIGDGMTVYSNSLTAYSTGFEGLDNFYETIELQNEVQFFY